MNAPDTYADRASPCACPPQVIALLGLAVRYAEASSSSAHPDVALGAQYVKTFMEQPAEVWCSFITIAEGEGATDGQ